MVNIKNMIELLYERIKAHIKELALIKHVAYYEEQNTNEASETAYVTPAVFVQFSDLKQSGLFWHIQFLLHLELKTLQRLEHTLNVLNSLESHLKEFRGLNKERINLISPKPAHKKGNAAVHILNCEIYLRI